MPVHLDTPVFASDGLRVGSVDRLVIHPASWKVLQIIVIPVRGPKRVMIPAASVERSGPGDTTLRLSSEEFRRAAPFDPATLERAPAHWPAPFQWPPGRIYWPAGYDGDVFPAISARQLRRWGTLRSTLRSGLRPDGDRRDVVTQDGCRVGRRGRVRSGPQVNASELVFEPTVPIWSEPSVTVPGWWIATGDRLAIRLAFDLPSLWAIVRQREGLPLALAAGGRLEQERSRELREDSLVDVDPYDVLSTPSRSGYKTLFERDEASMINPQARVSA